MSTLKSLVEYLQKKQIIFKSLKCIAVKELGSRKKVNIYLGVDIKGYYTDVMKIEKKSRVLRKEAGELMLLHEKLERYVDKVIKKKIYHYQSTFMFKSKVII